MATKMIVLALCVAAVMGGAIPQAAQYPAGVDPHICPNYPNCDNVALAARATGAAPAPYAAPSYSSYGHNAGAGVPRAAASYPAGVDPNVCPNYPYCGPTPSHVPAAPQNSWAAHAPQNSWNNAPAPQNSWNNAPVPQNTWNQAPSTGFGQWDHAPAELTNYNNAPSYNSYSAPAAPAYNSYSAPSAPSYNSYSAPAQSGSQGGDRFPAGVDPNSCPNYPYCH